MRGPICGDTGAPIRLREPPRRDGDRGVAVITVITHLGEVHGALLRLHVAAAGVRLRQLQRVVGPILLGFALREVDVPAREEGTRLGTRREVSPGLLSPPGHPTHLTSSSLMSSRRLMLGNFSCSSFLRPLLTPTGTTFTLLREEEEEGEEELGRGGAGGPPRFGGDTH